MPATAGEVLQEARARLTPVSSHPRRDAETLLSHVLGCVRVDLLSHPERLISPEDEARFESLIQRRVGYEPMQYIVGDQEFFGLQFEVTPDVLIPRPETEHLVEATLRLTAKAEILDVGTGSGAIAIALARHSPASHVTAVEISTAALEVARRNARRHGVDNRITFRESDLLASVEGQFDAIVSNPPYVAETEVLEPQVARYEPHTALFSGPTGLEIYRRLVPQALEHLKPGGWLLMEMGFGQSAALQELLHEWNNVSILNDLQGIPRIVQAEANRRSLRSAPQG